MLKTTQKPAKIQDFFERTYIINLPARADRRQQMAAELERVQMPLAPGKVEFFPAVRPEAAHAFPNQGVLGCFLSHLAILKQARQAGLSSVLVLEDDTAFTSDFARVEASLVKQLSQTDWSIVYLGYGPLPSYSYKDYYGDSLEATSEDCPVVLKRYELPLKGSHCYAVNGKALDPLIQFLENLLEQRLQQELIQMEGALPLDGAYFDTALYLFEKHYPEANSLIVCPNLSVQRSSRSDITPGRLDKLPLPSVVIDAIRAVKSLLAK